MKMPHSTDKERVFLSTLIKYPEVIPDYLDHLNDDLFFLDIHKTIAGSIRIQFKLKKTVDAVIIADHLSNIGLSNQDDTDIPDYIKTNVLRSAVTPDTIGVYFKDCFKYKVARSTIQSCLDTITEINKKINQPVSDIITLAEKNLAKASTCFIEDDYKTVDIYKDMDVFLEEISGNKDLKGVMTPFRTWNRWWGPLTVGDLDIIAAPPKTGKSTILNYLADVPFCRYNAGMNIKVLILDTELESFRVRTRKAAALSGVNESAIKNGSWQKDPEMVQKIQDQFATMKKRVGAVKHIYVANVPIEKIGGIVRRWKATETEPTDFCVVIYDYLKITGEKITDSNKEYQVMGQKCDYLKHLMSEIGAAGIAAIQTNAAQDIAMSNQIKWFASRLFLFRKKGAEELQNEDGKFGTHILQPFELRNHCEDWTNEEWVKIASPKGISYNRNYLNLKVENFTITECGTLNDIVKDRDEGGDIDIKQKRKLKEEIDL